MALGQAKRRDRKIEITDVAIDKVPYISYPGWPEETNGTIRALAQEVLALSRDENDNNEVAITFRPGDGSLGICYGDEHGVNPLSDTASAHLLLSGDMLTVVSLHNHPSTQSFSLEDIQFFIGYPSVRLMVLVSNQGVIHYLQKSDGYEPEIAYERLHDHFRMIRQGDSVKKMVEAADGYLRCCKDFGIDFKKG